MFRTALTASSRAVLTPSSRALHTTPVACKTVTQKAKEVASDVCEFMRKIYSVVHFHCPRLTSRSARSWLVQSRPEKRSPSRRRRHWVKSTSASMHGCNSNFGTGGGSVKEVADNVNKAVGRGLASTIEKGEEVTDATKQTLGWSCRCSSITSKADKFLGIGTATAKSKQAAGQASAKSKETADAVGQKANQASPDIGLVRDQSGLMHRIDCCWSTRRQGRFQGGCEQGTEEVSVRNSGTTCQKSRN